jgi:large subunit ribosomal protein L10
VDKATKELRVAELKQVVAGVSSLILTQYQGLKVETMTELRRSLRAANVGYKVVKNTLLRLATEGTSLSGLSKHLVGPIGMAWPLQDEPAAAAKACLEFARKEEKFLVKAGWADGEVLDEPGIKRLSTMPGKLELRAQLLSLLLTPPRQFLGLLQAAPRDFLCVLKARQEALEKAPAEPPAAPAEPPAEPPAVPAVEAAPAAPTA